MWTTIKLFIFAAIYIIGMVSAARTNTVWTGDLSYRIIHLLLFITGMIVLISLPKIKTAQTNTWNKIARWCFGFACLVYVLTYLSAVFVHDLPLLVK